MVDFYKINDLKKGEFEIEVSVPQEVFEEEKKKQFKKLAKNITVPGFRPGKAPADVLEARMGVKLYDEVLNTLLPKLTSEILDKESKTPLMPVEYSVDKIDIEKGIVEFKAKIVVFPEYKLPEFSKIKVKKEEAKISDEELQKFYENFVNDIAKRAKMENFEVKNVDDKWVEDQKIPNVKTVVELKEFLKKYQLDQKTRENEAKYINDILDEAIKLAKIEVPNKIIETEVAAKEKQDRERLEKIGINWEDWKKQQGENLEKRMKEDREKIEKDYKIQFLLVKVSEEAKIQIDKEKVHQMLHQSFDEKSIRHMGENNLMQALERQVFEGQLFEWIVKQVEGKQV